MSNNLTNAVESARASILLMDKQKKKVGQATRWVIGGSTNKPALPPNGTNVFYFVITSPEPFSTTNLNGEVLFERVTLEGGKILDPKRDVVIIK
jgi:hypothetical protein